MGKIRAFWPFSQFLRAGRGRLFGKLAFGILKLGKLSIQEIDYSGNWLFRKLNVREIEFVWEIEVWEIEIWEI